MSDLQRYPLYKLLAEGPGVARGKKIFENIFAVSFT